MVDSLQLVIIDGDLWSDSNGLVHDLGLLQVNGETTELADLNKLSQQSLELLLSVGCDACIVPKQQIPDGGLPYLGFGSKPGQVEKLPIRSGVEVDAFCCSAGIR